jgi:hypothetical protein
MAFAALTCSSGFGGLAGPLAGWRVVLFPPRHCCAVRAAKKAEMELGLNN